MGLPPSEHDPESVSDLADEILRQARYDEPSQSIPDRIMEWLGEQLTRLLEGLVGGGGGAARGVGDPARRGRSRRSTCSCGTAASTSRPSPPIPSPR